MKIKQKIAIVGAGVMGSIFACQLLRRKIVSSENLILLDKDSSKLQEFKKLFSCHTATKVASAGNAGIVLLAVKPQNFQELVLELKPFLKPEILMISIMAGITIKNISKKLGLNKIVRVMPNMPATIGAGVTSWYAVNLNFKEEEIVENILTAVGCALKLKKEKLIDASTAISGSGPAYVFYFMEQMMQEAKRLGFNSKDAREIVVNTFKGAVDLAKVSSESIELLRQKVTSKGGTTEAALAEFEKQQIGLRIKKGIYKAFVHSQKLGQ